jgi:hypothetical protein
MTVDVGKVKKFIVGLYGEELLGEVSGGFFIGRDLRAVAPKGDKLAGYHSRFVGLLDGGLGVVNVKFLSMLFFTKPGDAQARSFALDVGKYGGVDGVIQWFADNGYALQVSLSYTRIGRDKVNKPTKAFSGETHALYLVMIEFEDKRGGDNLEPVKKVVNEVVDRAATFVEEPFIVFSGNKSFYLVFALPTPVKGPVVVRDRFGRVVREYGLNEVYRAIFDLVLRDKSYLGLGSDVIERFVDTQVAEPKRLLRIPGFTHEVSGKPTQQLGVELTPIDFDPDALAKSVLPNSVLTDYWAYIDLPREERGRTGRKTTGGGTGWDCLPSWVKTLIDYLREYGKLCHYGRMAVAGWMIRCGFTDEEIHEVFKHADDYNARVTQYHINDVRKFLEEKGGKPMRCETVVKECGGHDAPSIDCKAPPKPVTKSEPTAVAPETKPETKPEVKPEAKPEAKPAEAKPVEERRETAPTKPIQTRLTRFVEKPREEKPEAKPSEEPKQASEPREERLVVINIPTTLVEDVARELRAPTTIAESLVNWVVDYLNRPCCWSVGFERLAIDLSRASDEEVQFALETLGIEVKERRITDDGFARLRTVVGTVIKYLEKAGFVEYVRDLGVVNLVRGDNNA